MPEVFPVSCFPSTESLSGTGIPLNSSGSREAGCDRNVSHAPVTQPGLVGYGEGIPGWEGEESLG